MEKKIDIISSIRQRTSKRPERSSEIRTNFRKRHGKSAIYGWRESRSRSWIIRTRKSCGVKNHAREIPSTSRVIELASLSLSPPSSCRSLFTEILTAPIAPQLVQLHVRFDIYWFHGGNWRHRLLSTLEGMQRLSKSVRNWSSRVNVHDSIVGGF